MKANGENMYEGVTICCSPGKIVIRFFDRLEQYLGDGKRMDTAMDEFILTNEIIGKVKKEAFVSVRGLMGADLTEMILYGSCARGDFTSDSDVDIALLTKCDRIEAKKYDDGLDLIATNLAMKYFAVVNFVCFPYYEFEEKKSMAHIF